MKYRWASWLFLLLICGCLLTSCRISYRVSGKGEGTEKEAPAGEYAASAENETAQAADPTADSPASGSKASVSAAGDFTEDPAAMEEAAASVVRLEIYDEKDKLIGTGSGFCAFSEEVLVTAAHVIKNVEYITATRDDGSTFRIEQALDANEDADVAILKLPKEAALTVLPVQTEALLRGESAAAIGSQFGILNMVTLGNICGRWETENVNWILFSAPVSGGSSGGPLFDSHGDVIGVITGTYEKGQNLNLAAPIGMAEALYPSDEIRSEDP